MILLISLYECLCERKSLISPHLIDLEKEAFDINTDEISILRKEVRK